MKIFTIGDIHGCHKGLVQVLERSGFDKDNDLLITLGDIVDGCHESFQCVEELLTIKNRIDIMGNHDKTFYDWLCGKGNKYGWSQGGIHTAQSYADGMGISMHKEVYYEDNIFGGKDKKYNISLLPASIDLRHFMFFSGQHKFYVDDRNRAFVHGGYANLNGLGYDDSYVYMWNRDLWQKNAMMSSQNMPKLLRPYKKIFIGHTNTLNWSQNEPMFKHNVVNLDTGAGIPKGKLTIMNVDTEEYWQSDKVSELYPNYKMDE